jgi:large subunit ribosomal protein L23
MRSPETIIIRPLMTEKGSMVKEGPAGADAARTQVVFEVATDANKIEIRQAVKKLWNVEVSSVRTMRMPGKVKRVGRFVGRSSQWKKALVTLAPGQNIEFFEGV